MIEALRIGPGVRVADIGAGTGYYTLRIAARLGPAATIYAQDVNAAWLAELRARLDREMLYSVTTVLGTPADPGLPPQSVDIALMGHMYHEIESPYEFLYNLHSAIAPGGRVAVVDVDQETRYHGTPAGLLRCEFEAVGYRQVDFVWLASAGYLAVFEPPDQLPAVADIEACGGE